MPFTDHIARVLEFEGGFVDHPSDPGGATNFGVSLKAHPGLGGKGIAALRVNDAIEIYRREYWAAVRGDELDLLSPSLALIMLDTAIHSGPSRAIKLLQVSLRSLGIRMVTDGVLGDITMAALLKCDHKRLKAHLLAERALFLTELKNWGAFKRGWMRRLFSL